MSKEKPTTMLTFSSGPYRTTPEERLANIFDPYAGVLQGMEQEFNDNLPVDVAVKYYNAIGGNEKSYNLFPRLVKELQFLEKYRMYHPLVVTIQKILDYMLKLYNYAENHVIIQNGTEQEALRVRDEILKCITLLRNQYHNIHPQQH